MSFIFRKNKRTDETVSTCTEKNTSQIIHNNHLKNNDGNIEDSSADVKNRATGGKEDFIRNVTQSGHTKNINNSMIMVDNQLYSSDILMIDNELYTSSDLRNNNEPTFMIDNEIYAKY